MPVVTISRQTRMSHDVRMSDVGHGTCILVRSEDFSGLLVDCGAIRPQRYCQVPEWIETYIPMTNICGFVISHFHSDHYNLFPCFDSPQRLFSKVYVPDLPASGPAQQISRAIMEFVTLASKVDFRNYRILPDIFNLLKRKPIPRRKGQTIREAKSTFYVFWPDIDHRRLKKTLIIKKAREMRKRMKSFVHKYKMPTEFDADNLVEQFFEFLTRKEGSEPTEPLEREQVKKILCGLEKDFKDLGDHLSLAFKSYDNKEKTKFLFLGDLSSEILSSISISRRSYTYDVIQAAHHGTRFGKSLENLSTRYLLVSRSQQDFSNIQPIHNGYLNRKRFAFILDTEFLGNCHIRNGKLLITR